MCCKFFFFQAEDGIRDLVRSRGLGDVYKRQELGGGTQIKSLQHQDCEHRAVGGGGTCRGDVCRSCLLYTSDAADELLCVDLGGRRIIKKKTHTIN